MTNGDHVVRITRKGIVAFAFGTDAAFHIDAIKVHDQWWAVEMDYLDAEGRVPKEKHEAWQEERRAFVQNVVKTGYDLEKVGAEEPILTQTEVAEFMARLYEEVGKLRLFFAPVTPGQQSSPDSTAIRFSQ